MTVKDIIIIAGELLGETEAVKYLTGQVAADGEYARLCAAELKGCYDAIIEELALEYLPVKQTELFNVNDKKVRFEQFSQRPIHIYSVTSETGEKLPYKIVNDYLSVPSSDFYVTYSYRPRVQNEDDECLYARQAGVGKYLIAYGVASEFCIRRGKIGESDLWQDKYMKAVKGRLAKRGSLKIPARSWT